MIPTPATTVLQAPQRLVQQASANPSLPMTRPQRWRTGEEGRRVIRGGDAELRAGGAGPALLDGGRGWDVAVL
eukprot:COSAG01_NODE_9296_length_2491_cov_9.354933_1_plen_72_part_10